MLYNPLWDAFYFGIDANTKNEFYFINCGVSNGKAFFTIIMWILYIYKQKHTPMTVSRGLAFKRLNILKGVAKTVQLK